MAIKTIFKSDKEKQSDELEIYSNSEGFLTISMENPNIDCSFCMIHLNKDNALMLLEFLTKEIDLL